MLAIIFSATPKKASYAAFDPRQGYIYASLLAFSLIHSSQIRKIIYLSGFEGLFPRRESSIPLRGSFLRPLAPLDSHSCSPLP